LSNPEVRSGAAHNLTVVLDCTLPVQRGASIP
jgi:hypothetical protein